MGETEEGSRKISMTSYHESPVSRTDWETPASIFSPLHEEFHFTLDVCATSLNAKCPTFFTPTQDGLLQPWSGVCWMNPPYGWEINKWITKAHASAALGCATVVCLLPVRSNCEWWRFCIEGEIRFIRKKVRFVGAPSTSMFPNVIVIFHPFLTPGGVMKIWRPFP